MPDFAAIFDRPHIQHPAQTPSVQAHPHAADASSTGSSTKVAPKSTQPKPQAPPVGIHDLSVTPMQSDKIIPATAPKPDTAGEELAQQQPATYNEHVAPPQAAHSKVATPNSVARSAGEPSDAQSSATIDRDLAEEANKPATIGWRTESPVESAERDTATAVSGTPKSASHSMAQDELVPEQTLRTIASDKAVAEAAVDDALVTSQAELDTSLEELAEQSEYEAQQAADQAASDAQSTAVNEEESVSGTPEEAAEEAATQAQEQADAQRLALTQQTQDAQVAQQTATDHAAAEKSATQKSQQSLQQQHAAQTQHNAQQINAVLSNNPDYVAQTRLLSQESPNTNPSDVVANLLKLPPQTVAQLAARAQSGAATYV